VLKLPAQLAGPTLRNAMKIMIALALVLGVVGLVSSLHSMVTEWTGAFVMFNCD
jgi:hypothetical protein